MFLFSSLLQISDIKFECCHTITHHHYEFEVKYCIPSTSLYSSNKKETVYRNFSTSFWTIYVVKISCANGISSQNQCVWIIYLRWIDESNSDAELDHRRVRSIAKQILCQFLHTVDSMPLFLYRNIVYLSLLQLNLFIKAYHSKSNR